jgi:hypothetical protein
VSADWFDPRLVESGRKRIDVGCLKPIRELDSLQSSVGDTPDDVREWFGQLTDAV